MIAPMRAAFRSSLRRQRLRAVPHYLAELRRLRSPAELLGWWQFKLPYTLPLPSFPPRVTIELTNRCNFGCPHCHRSSMNRDLGAMEFETLEKLVAEIGEHKDTILKVGGLGEPSIYPRVAEFLLLLKKHEVKSIFYTNGTLLHRFAHDEILDWNMPHLVVSIDGIDKESFEKARVGGNYERLRATLGAFHRRREERGLKRPMIEVRHVIMPRETEKDLSDFRKQWLTMADTVMFNPLNPDVPIHSNGHRPRRKCRDIRREMYVRWTGKIPVCCLQYLVDKDQWIGDLKKTTIRETWNHPALELRRAQHNEGGNAVPDFCGRCPLTN